MQGSSLARSLASSLARLLSWLWDKGNLPREERKVQLTSSPHLVMSVASLGQFLCCIQVLRELMDEVAKPLSIIFEKPWYKLLYICNKKINMPRKDNKLLL